MPTNCLQRTFESQDLRQLNCADRLRSLSCAAVYSLRDYSNRCFCEKHVLENSQTILILMLCDPGFSNFYLYYFNL